MPLMQWTAKLSVGVAAIDAEHKQLVKLLNELFDAMQDGQGRAVVGKTLAGLIIYTKTHFANEERLLRQHGYPGLPTQMAEHDALTKQVIDVQRKFDNDPKALITVNVLNFLRDWLTNHILGLDHEYMSFLNAKGVR